MTQPILPLALPRRHKPVVAIPRVRSEDLLRESKEVVIVHQGQEYRLRLTRNDKLILNK